MNSTNNHKNPSKGWGKMQTCPPCGVFDYYAIFFHFFSCLPLELFCIIQWISENFSHVFVWLHCRPLYSTFQSPWADGPCRPQDIDYHVPSEYLINVFIREKLAPIKLHKYGEDLLFYMFYSNPGDILQLAASSELWVLFSFHSSSLFNSLVSGSYPL